MRKQIVSSLLCGMLAAALFVGCGSAGTANNAGNGESPKNAGQENAQTGEADSPAEDFKGETLSILTSTGWMNNKYDKVISAFEDAYGVTVDLQTIPADQYSDLLKSRLNTNSCADVFWISSNPFAIESVLLEPEKYCIDFTSEAWASLIPESRRSSCEYDGKLYGLLPGSASVNTMIYNKTLFEENGWSVPETYEDFKAVCDEILAKGITPWYMPGADGWQHQMPFFQIGGVYEAAEPGLYEKLNNNEATFAGNQKMLEVLAQFKEFSDLGYFGEDWIGTDSTDMVNALGERRAAMSLVLTSSLTEIKEDTGTTDEFAFFTCPFGDNQYFPLNPGGPAMFGYKESEHPELVKAWFSFVTRTESLQSILDSSPTSTNIDLNDPNIEQHWLEEEKAYIDSVPEELKQTPVLQVGTMYTNDFWTQFGQDLVAYCQGNMEADKILENMDANRAELARTLGNPAWE